MFPDSSKLFQAREFSVAETKCRREIDRNRTAWAEQGKKIPAFILDHFHPHQWSPSTTWHTQHSPICRPQLQPPTLFYIKVEESEMDVLKKTVSAKPLYRTKKKDKAAAYGKGNLTPWGNIWCNTNFRHMRVVGVAESEILATLGDVALQRLFIFCSLNYNVSELVRFVASECCSCGVCRLSVSRCLMSLNFLITILLTRYSDSDEVAWHVIYTFLGGNPSIARSPKTLNSLLGWDYNLV